MRKLPGPAPTRLAARCAKAFALAALPLASAACGGGGGDPLTAPIANAYGGGTQLHDLLGPATWLDPTNILGEGCAGFPPDRAIDVGGLTVAGVDTYDETGEGAVGNVYVRDSLAVPVAYSGITVFDPGFSPPDLRVVQGDVVDLRGTLMEFPGPSSGPFPYCRSLPEASGTLSLRFDGGETESAADITVADLSSYESARQWFGVLVRLTDVTISADPDPPSNGRYEAPLVVDAGATEQPVINNEMFDLEGEGPPLAAGTVLSSVTGVVTFFYTVHIAPRSAADIVP